MKKLFVLIIVTIFLSCVFEENHDIDYSKDFSLDLNSTEQDTCQTALEELLNE